MRAALALSLLPALLHAQVDLPVFGKQNVINGYAKDVEGEVLSYFSVYPEHATTALLTRCTDGKKAIAWETAPVNFDETDITSFFYFSWIAAHNSTTSGGDRSFDLYTNDTKALTFTTHHSTAPGSWEADGTEGTKLVFEFRKKDRHGDAHGFAHLRVPRKYITPGKPLRLKMVGHAQDSPDWFMTFRYTFEEKVEIEALPFLVKKGEKRFQPVQLTVMHFGGKAKLRVWTYGFPAPTVFDIKNGLQTMDVMLEEVKEPARVHVLAAIDRDYEKDTLLPVLPVIHRDIHLIHHSHTDIGYSHLQAEVEVIQNNNIWKALELIDRTKDYPKDSRFVWNVESLWAVENFLGIASEADKQRFIAAVKAGSIALSANYANLMTGLCTPEEMHWIVEYADSLRSWYGLPITMAMQTDVPGMSWSMVDAYAAHGIRHLSQGPNYIPDMPDGGDRIGSTLREQGDKPYWWVGTTGKDSILVWTAGQGYGGWHGYTAGAIKERGTRKIAAYMNELAAKGYPYDMVQWRYNIVSDNGPVDSTLSDFVREWNEKYASPRLIIANAGKMMQEFEAKYGRHIPTWSGDFTPYWEDGAYSTAKEEGDVRVLSARLSNLIEAAKILGKPIDPHLLYRAKRSIVMWHEHTWGAWCSISDPDAHFTTDQWRVKKAFADSAGWYVDARWKSPLALTDEPGNVGRPSTHELYIPVLPMESCRRCSDPSTRERPWPVRGFQATGTKKGSHTCGTTSRRTRPCAKQAVEHLDDPPFNIPNATVRIGIGDTCVTPESGRIPGSNNDFFCAQRWIDVSNDSMGVTIVCPQGALWEVGEMVDERKVNPGKGTNPEYVQGLEDRGEEQQHPLPLRPQQLLAHQLQGRPGRAHHLRPLPEDARAVQAGGGAAVRAGDDAAVDHVVEVT
jgi:alpha-mannosidase